VSDNNICCLTLASEIREALGGGFRDLKLAFLVDHSISELDVTMVSVRPMPGGREGIVCILQSAQLITLILPTMTGQQASVMLEGWDRIVALVGGDNTPPREVLALEEWLRRQESEILRGAS
jgi:hypothetical protein